MRRWEEIPKRAWGAQWFRGRDHSAMALMAVLPRTQGEGLPPASGRPRSSPLTWRRSRPRPRDWWRRPSGL